MHLLSYHKLEHLRRFKHEYDRASQTEPAHLLRERERLAVEQGRCGREDSFVVGAW